MIQELETIYDATSIHFLKELDSYMTYLYSMRATPPLHIRVRKEILSEIALGIAVERRPGLWVTLAKNGKIVWKGAFIYQEEEDERGERFPFPLGQRAPRLEIGL